jgi:hypothetical protein
MRDRRSAYRVLVGRSEKDRPLRKPRIRREDNIKMDLEEVGRHIDWIDLLRIGTGGGLVNAVLNLWVP